MKIVFSFALLIFGLGLMSFSVAPNNSVSRLGDQLYLVDETAQFTDADRAEILSSIAEGYKLGDWRTIKEDFYSDGPISAKANWILYKKAFVKAVKEKFIKYDATVVSEDVRSLDAIMVRYAK